MFLFDLKFPELNKARVFSAEINIALIHIDFISDLTRWQINKKEYKNNRAQ